jgi:hypothetical protein
MTLKPLAAACGVVKVASIRQSAIGLPVLVASAYRSNFSQFAAIAIRHTLLTFALIVMAGNAVAQAPMSDLWLQRLATHIFTGVAVQKAERQQQYRGAERILGELQIALTEDQPGLAMKAGDTVVVRYWRIEPDKGTDPLKQQPIGSLIGHWGIPKISDKVTVFVKGSQSAGFDVLEPNGFQRAK